jgi:Transposase DDE domain
LWYQEESGELAKKRFRRENWTYDAQSDTYTCPNQRILVFKEETKRTSENGYERTVRLYECQSCDNCPFASECKRGQDKVYVEYGLLSIAHNLRKVYCKESGIWAEYYAQRASKKGEKRLKRA